MCWLYWPQAKLPYSQEMLEYIHALDAEADMDLLRCTLKLAEDCLMTLFIGTTLIKASAHYGLTLHDTSMLMVRESPHVPSALEQVVSQALHLAECNTHGVGADFYSALKLQLRDLIWDLVNARSSHMAE